MAFELPEGWQVVRNARALGNHWVTLASPEQSTAITIELVREDSRSRALPLHMLADVLPLEAGRSLGLQSMPMAHHQIELAGREAWATTVKRRHGPEERLVSALYSRVDQHLLVLTLHTLAEAPKEVLTGWDTVMSTLWLPADPAPEVAPFQDHARDEAALEWLPDGGEGS